MGMFSCDKCGRILLKTKTYLGKKYCQSCYDDPSFVELRRQYYINRILNSNESYSDRNVKLDLKEYDEEWDIIINAYEIKMHKLFTYKYDNSECYAIIALSLFNGMPYIITKCIFGDEDGLEKSVRIEKITYDSLKKIINQKNVYIRNMFDGLNGITWKNYLDKTYLDEEKTFASLYIKTEIDGKFHIGIARKGDKFNLSYVICSKAEYLKWAKEKSGLLDCLKSHGELRNISEYFSEKKIRSVFRGKLVEKLFFNISIERTEGNDDILLSYYCGTILREYTNVNIPNLKKILDEIKQKCNTK